MFERNDVAPDSFADLMGRVFCEVKAFPPAVAWLVMNSEEVNDLASNERFRATLGLASNFGVRKLGAGEVAKDFPEWTGAPPDFRSERLKVLFGFSWAVGVEPCGIWESLGEPARVGVKQVNSSAVGRASRRPEPSPEPSPKRIRRTNVR